MDFSLPGFESLLVESLDIVYVLLIIVASVALSAAIKHSLKCTGEKIRLPRDTRKSAYWVIDLVIYSLATILSLYALGFDAGALFAGVGIFALAVGFAAQQLLSNLIAGFIIIVGKPFRIGDMITFEGKTGWVEGIGLRSTVISTHDSNTVVVPNANLINSVLVNSTGGRRKMLATMSVLLENDADIAGIAKKAKTLPIGIRHVLTDTPDPVQVFLRPVEKIGKSKYQLDMLFWIDDSRNERRVMTELSCLLKKITP